MKWYSITTIEYKQLRRYVAARQFYAIPPLPESLEHKRQSMFTKGSSFDTQWWRMIENLIADDEDNLTLVERQRLVVSSSSVVSLVNNNMRARSWEVWILGCLTNRHQYFTLLRKALKSWRIKAITGSIAKDVLYLGSQHNHISKTTRGLQHWIRKRIERAKYLVSGNKISKRNSDLYLLDIEK